jgi:hypothetical protein
MMTIFYGDAIVVVVIKVGVGMEGGVVVVVEE